MDSDDTNASHEHSVTWMIERLKDADTQAAADIWRRFFERLLPLDRARLRALSDRSVDEEDVLISAFDRFFRAVREDRFAKLDDRDDLWQILLMLVDREVARQFRRSQAQKRGSGQTKSVEEIGDIDLRELVDRGPDPAFVAAFSDQLLRALSRLVDESTRSTVLLKLEGYENREIASQLGISLSSVERKLRLVREAWQMEFGR
jgi:RNA polymerase sigma factor (sigma-70 family)